MRLNHRIATAPAIEYDATVGQLLHGEENMGDIKQFFGYN